MTHITREDVDNYDTTLGMRFKSAAGRGPNAPGYRRGKQEASTVRKVRVRGGAVSRAEEKLVVPQVSEKLPTLIPSVVPKVSSPEEYLIRERESGQVDYIPTPQERRYELLSGYRFRRPTRVGPKKFLNVQRPMNFEKMYRKGKKIRKIPRGFVVQPKKTVTPVVSDPRFHISPVELERFPVLSGMDAQWATGGIARQIATKIPIFGGVFAKREKPVPLTFDPREQLTEKEAEGKSAYEISVAAALKRSPWLARRASISTSVAQPSVAQTAAQPSVAQTAAQPSVTRTVSTPSEYFRPEEVFLGGDEYYSGGYYYNQMNGDDFYSGGYYYNQMDGFFSKLLKPIKKVLSKIDPIYRKKAQQKDKRGIAEADRQRFETALKNPNLTDVERKNLEVQLQGAQTRLGMATKNLAKVRKTEKVVAAIAATVVGGVMFGPQILGGLKAAGGLVGKGIGLIKSGAVAAGKAMIGSSIASGLSGQKVPKEVADATSYEVAEIAAQTGEMPSQERIGEIMGAAYTAYQARQGNYTGVEAMQNVREDVYGNSQYRFGEDASAELSEQDEKSAMMQFVVPAAIGGIGLIALIMMRKR